MKLWANRYLHLVLQVGGCGCGGGSLLLGAGRGRRVPRVLLLQQLLLPLGLHKIRQRLEWQPARCSSRCCTDWSVAAQVNLTQRAAKSGLATAR